MKHNYEEMTVPELKDLADQRGVELLSDARKFEIIAALEASDLLLTGDSKEAETPEARNVYEYQMSSTETALVNQDDFWRIKLHS